MDIAAIVKQARATREFRFERDGHTALLRLPSDLDLSIIYAEEASVEKAAQRIVRGAITGWEGVLVRHLVPDAPAEVADNLVECTPESVEEFFASRGELFMAIGGEVFKRINARRSAAESAEKN